VRMWAATSQNISPELAVVGTLLIVLVIVISLALRLFASERSASAHAVTLEPKKAVQP